MGYWEEIQALRAAAQQRRAVYGLDPLKKAEELEKEWFANEICAWYSCDVDISKIDMQFFSQWLKDQNIKEYECRCYSKGQNKYTFYFKHKNQALLFKMTMV